MYRKYQRYRALTISGPFRGTCSAAYAKASGKRPLPANEFPAAIEPIKKAEAPQFAVRCYASARTPVNATTFGRRITALNFKPKKVGGSMRYEGIAVRGARPELMVIEGARTSSVA